jgi:DNA-binding Lrp family transcriptional regulator
MGFGTRAKVILKVKPEIRTKLKEFLMNHKYVNSIYKINNGFDFMIDVIFENMNDLEYFIEMLEEKFELKSRMVFYVIEELMCENFLSNPNHVDERKNKLKID